MEALDPIAAKFTEAEDKAVVVAELKAKVATLEGEDATNGEIYVKMAEKGVEKVRWWCSGLCGTLYRLRALSGA